MENTSFENKDRLEIACFASDEVDINRRLDLGSQAPDFMANTTFGPCKLSDYRGKWLVFFSHPGDFTPVGTLFVELKISN